MKTRGSYLIFLVTTCCHESVVLPRRSSTTISLLVVVLKISTSDSSWGVGFTYCTRRFLYRSSLLMFRPLP
ncbi:hypothetical protein PRUPE_6G016900 [Prunus persica]|uniref:Uncharacterized protein n=1 Tax=Prunus persica TaxID=3760 RepID=M5VYU9_PRUPE|nr:hypothetical protein PRUPE_6G016900 [Prunus persica]